VEQQFSDTQRTAAIDLLETLPWGDIERKIYGLEAALALALEAVGDAVRRWEEEGEDLFGDEVTLSPEQVASLDSEWRFAYIARLLDTAALAYGVPSFGSPGRNADGEPTSPASWNEDPPRSPGCSEA
jgi:hypothetical protein